MNRGFYVLLPPEKQTTEDDTWWVIQTVEFSTMYLHDDANIHRGLSHSFFDNFGATSHKVSAEFETEEKAIDAAVYYYSSWHFDYPYTLSNNKSNKKIESQPMGFT